MMIATSHIVRTCLSASGALAVMVGLAACATSGGVVPESAAARLDDSAPRPGLPTILVAMPGAPDFLDVRRGLLGEVRKSFNVSTLLVTQETTVPEVAAAIERARPVCIVLMNNATLTLFHAYEAAHKDKPAIPTVVVMASFLDDVRGQLRRATGISYEVPGVTAFVNLRAIVEVPIHRIGVVYRPAFKSFVNRQQGPASKEDVTIVGRQLPRDFSAEDLRKQLRALIQEDRVDALWMLNDNLLARDAQLIGETWCGDLGGAKVPLIVGVPNLVDPAVSLGTLAVVPDHEALGLQAANLIFELAESGWNVEERRVDMPLSVKTVVDLRQVRERFHLRPDASGRIDRALE